MGNSSAKFSRSRRIVLGCFRLALLVAVAIGPAFGDSDGSVQVTVRCEALKGRSGTPLRVLHATPLGVNAARLPSEPIFDRGGECRVELSPGEYAFEVGAVDGQTILALRTPPRRIANGAVVEIKATEPQPLVLKTTEDQELRIEGLAVRSAATTGEVTWSGGSNAAPLLIMSPGQQYRIRALGGNQDLRFAIWQEISTTKMALLLNGGPVCRCKFNIRTDGPAIRAAMVRLQFPDAEMKFPVTDKTMFLTNRRFISFGYGIELANGRKIAFRPWLGIVKSDQEFQLGGPFSAAAWARIMVRKPVGGPETHHLVCDANLYDALGHMVLVEQSQIDWRDSARFLSGAEVPRGRPLAKEEVAAFKVSGDTLVVDVSYQLDSPVSATLRPERFRPYGNRRFHTSAPPHWELQALNYLAKAERVYHLVEDLEGKPSKHRVEVRWHAMDGAAWGCAPSGNKAHIMMPFSGLKKNFNFYDDPWALAHEMLHTFGYGHGQRMDQMSGLVGRRFEQYRWYMSDHPELDPESAFNGFRGATRVDRALSPPIAPPAAKKKGGQKNGGQKKGGQKKGGRKK